MSFQEKAVKDGIAMIENGKISDAMNEIRVGINCHWYDQKKVTDECIKSLDEKTRQAAENRWLETYGQAFRGTPRLKQGVKAEDCFRGEPCSHYLIVPFSSAVDGLPIGRSVLGRMAGYECRGPLVPLGDFASIEFFLCPIDLSWSMVHTHEDHALGGPYFVRLEWLAG